MVAQRGEPVLIAARGSYPDFCKTTESTKRTEIADFQPNARYPQCGWFRRRCPRRSGIQETTEITETTESAIQIILLCIGSVVNSGSGCGRKARIQLGGAIGPKERISLALCDLCARCGSFFGFGRSPCLVWTTENTEGLKDCGLPHGAGRIRCGESGPWCLVPAG